MSEIAASLKAWRILAQVYKVTPLPTTFSDRFPHKISSRLPLLGVALYRHRLTHHSINKTTHPTGSKTLHYRYTPSEDRSEGNPQGRASSLLPLFSIRRERCRLPKSPRERCGGWHRCRGPGRCRLGKSSEIVSASHIRVSVLGRVLLTISGLRVRARWI